MLNSNNNNKESDDNLYKGLFLGLLLGVGLVWFLGTPSGKDMVKVARKRIDELLSAEPGLEVVDEESLEPGLETETSSVNLLKPRRFFSKK